jgi:hypothetical protein
MTSGLLIGHIISKDGIPTERDKVKAVLEAPASHNAKALSPFLGQIMLREVVKRNKALTSSSMVEESRCGLKLREDQI